MSRPFTVCALILLCGQGAAQETFTFNRVYDNQVGGPAIGKSVKEVDSAYVVFSYQRGLSGANLAPFTARYAPDGEPIEENEYPIGWYTQIGAPDPIARSGFSQCFYGACTQRTASGVDSLYLARFNYEGHRDMLVFLMTDTVMIGRKCIQGHNGDLLFTGLHEPPKEQYVLRTDSLGGIKDYFTFPGYDGIGIAEDASGDLYLTGFRISDSKGSLIKCDSVGEVEWTRFLNPQGTWRTPVVLSDGSVLVVGGWQEPPLGYNMAKVSRYSAGGTLLWTDDARQSTNANYGGRTVDAFQRADGSLVVGGNWGTDVIGNNGWVQGYSLSGDSLWSTRFTYYDSLGPSGFHFIWDLEPTSDGGMILTGEAWDISQASPQNVWLVKLDSVGCLVPGCQSVGVAEQATNLAGTLQLWPNPVPAGGTLHVALPEALRNTPQLRVALVAADGRCVAEQRLVPGLVQQEVALPALPTGVYYVHVAAGHTWLAGSKLVVQ